MGFLSLEVALMPRDIAPTYFAIRHKPSGRYLPELPGQRGGYTHLEPRAWHLGPIRLFPIKRNARLALKIWLRGMYNVRRSYGNFEENDIVEAETEPVPSRKAEEMEIVEFELQEVAIHND
jgi:hypothetical protein